jgi:hypothetical protein
LCFELSPDEARGTFPGFVYQLGNLIASVNATLQTAIAAHYGGNYAFALAVVAGTMAVAIVILTALGNEAKGMEFGNAQLREAEAAARPRRWPHRADIGGTMGRTTRGEYKCRERSRPRSAAMSCSTIRC